MTNKHQQRLDEIKSVSGVTDATLHKNFDSSLFSSFKNSIANPNARGLIEELTTESVIYRVETDSKEQADTVVEKLSDDYKIRGGKYTLFIQPKRF